jgi:hypothetical protein
VLAEASAANGGDLTHLLTNSTFTDWNIGITASTNYLPGTFRVVFSFLGDVSAGDEEPMVGQWMQLMPKGTNEAWKTHRRDRRIRRFASLEPTKNGTIMLTPNLLDQVAAGQLASLDASDVVPYLHEHLAWRVTGVRHYRLFQN